MQFLGPLSILDEEDGSYSPTSPRSFYRSVTWDNGSTPLRLRKPTGIKRALPQPIKRIKRYKSSPQLIPIDRPKPRDLEEEQRQLDEFKRLIMAGLPPPPRKNLFSNLNQNLNDSLTDGPLIKEPELENEPNNDSFLSNSEIARLEADALRYLEEHEREEEEQANQATVAKKTSAPAIVEKSQPKAPQGASLKQGAITKKTSAPLVVQKSQPKAILVVAKFSDDYFLDDEEIARIEAEALEQLKAEEIEESSQIATGNFIVKASSTQKSTAVETQIWSSSSSSGNGQSCSNQNTAIETQIDDDSDLDEEEIKRMFAEGEKLLKQQEIEELSQVEKKFEDCFTNPGATSTQKKFFVPPVRAPAVNAPSTSSTLSQADRERIERNRQEALRRRQIYQQNQRKLHRY